MPTPSTRSSLTRYLRDVARHPPIDRDQEHRLALDYQRTGSRQAAEALACGHLRLVVKIAREYRWSGHDLVDLIEEGNLGLLQAVRKFDPQRGVRLSSYAAWWIRAMILHFVIANRRLVRIGTTVEQRKVMARLRDARAELERQGRTVDAAALAQAMGVHADGLDELAHHIDASEVALDAPVSTEHERVARLELLPAAAEDRPDEQVAAAEQRVRRHETLLAFAATLDERDRRLFRSRWLGDEQPTLQEMGKRFGVSRERARQLEGRVLARLRRFAAAGAA